MMGILRWFTTFLVSVVVIVFSISNLELVGVHWSPFHPSYNLPLYAVILAALSLGFFWGGLMVWFSGSKTRSKLRQANKDIKRLETDVEEARKTSQASRVLESHTDE